MHNTVGQIASKEDFYMREREITRLWRSLDAKANIQLAAPRRVGKSSILYHLKDNPRPGNICIYVEVESAGSKNEFYRKIYREVIKSEIITTGKKFKEQVKANKGFLARLKGISIAGFGIDFSDLPDINYEEELTNLLIGINLDGDKLILMIDEFPEVILNIVESQKGEIGEAKNFLQSNRELRNRSELHGKVQFIYTGSNSLNITVANLDASVLINDLNALPVEPLRPAEAKDLMRKVLSTYGYVVEDFQLEYILSKVEWYIPFYFQLLMQEIISQIDPSEHITKALIDSAFEKIMDQRNNHHFDHYIKRLKRIFNDAERKFVHALLSALAQTDTLSKSEVQNLSFGTLTEAQMRKVIDALRYDGYIINLPATGSGFKFNSPILKQWWYTHEC